MELLSSVDVVDGVNERGVGFVTVAAHGDRGTILAGQLTPDEVRTLAMHWLAVAEAAEQDAAVLRVVRALGLPDAAAAAVITELRDGRAE